MAVAELFNEWIKCVIQASQPWISTRDIDRGSIWFSEINDQLSSVSFGIVFLTQENKNKPWILFETGALAKGLSSNRVCTFLIDLNPSDLQDPLAQFNHTKNDKSSVLSLTRTINTSLGDNRIEDKILERIFETYWPQFESGFKKSLQDTPEVELVEPRSEHEILSEILDNTRSLTTRVRRLENEQDTVISDISKLLQSDRKKQVDLISTNISDQLVNQDDIKRAISENAFKMYRKKRTTSD